MELKERYEAGDSSVIHIEDIIECQLQPGIVLSFFIGLFVELKDHQSSRRWILDDFLNERPACKDFDIEYINRTDYDENLEYYKKSAFKNVSLFISQQIHSMMKDDE